MGNILYPYILHTTTNTYEVSLKTLKFQLLERLCDR